MASSLPAGERADVTRLGKGEKLSTIERIAVLAVVGTIVTFDIVGLFLPPGLDPLTAALGIASTAVLALYLWSPLIATYALGVVFALSFIPGIEAQVLTTAAFAAGLIVRLGWTSLVLSYAGVFLLASALVVTGDSRDAFNIAIFLVGAAVSGAVGFAPVSYTHLRAHET